MIMRYDDKFQRHRLRQPLEELDRKARKARRKDIWTQEEIDAAMKEAEETCRILFGFKGCGE